MPDQADMPQDADTEWRQAVEDVRAAKEHALLVVMGRKPLTPDIVRRAREALDTEDRLLEQYPGRLPLRVELGNLSADIGYVDLARYLATVLRELADDLDATPPPTGQ